MSQETRNIAAGAVFSVGMFGIWAMFGIEAFAGAGLCVLVAIFARRVAG